MPETVRLVVGDVIVRAPGPQGRPGHGLSSTDPADEMLMVLQGSDPEQVFRGRLVAAGDTVTLEWDEHGLSADYATHEISLVLDSSDPERVFRGRLVGVGDTVTLEWEEVE